MIILSFVKAIKQLDSLLQQLKGIVDHCVVSFLSFILLISWWFCLNYSPGWSWLSLQFKIEESLKPLNFSKQIFALKTSSRWSFVKTSDLTLNKCISTFNFLTQIVGKLHSYFCTHYFFLAKFKMTTLVACKQTHCIHVYCICTTAILRIFLNEIKLTKILLFCLCT